MKVSLVVAAGSHEGRQIPLTGSEFLIGRDPQCHLRPASQAISKLHCAVRIRDGKVYVKDYGSTNGTLVDGAVVKDAEVAIADGATLRVGPLDFRVKIEVLAPNPDGTPMPAENAAALAAVKAAAGAAPGAPARDTTPAPVRPKPGTAPQPQARPTAAGAKPTKPEAKPGSKESPALKPGTQEAAALQSSESVTDEDHDRIAAMLLGMDDDGNGSVPDGSTVMDIPTPLLSGTDETGKPGEKKEDDKPKKAQTREEMSNAANDLLRKYMRRPK
jgi:predicted component of type VI protein secretion system